MAEENVVESEATDTTAPDTAAPATEAPAEPKEAAPSKPLMADDSLDDAPAKPTDFPDDWRERLAGDDKALGNILKRLGSPADMAKKLAEQEKLIRSGKHKEAPGKDASEKEIAEYRKSLGVPDEPAGYFDKLEGLAISDDDKPLVEGFLAEAHEAGMAPKDVQTALGAYYKIQEQKAAETADADRAFRSEAEEALREQMGADFKANMTDLKSWLSSQEGLFDTFIGSRGPDGRLFGDNPAVMSWLVSQMREINPLSTVVGGTGGSVESVTQEIARIEKMMRDDRGAYEKDTGLQERLRQLYEAEEKYKKRAA